MKKEELEKFIETQEIVSVYTNEESESFDVGIFLAVDEEYLIYNAINKFGEDNGLVCIKIEDIFKISYDGKYEKMIKKLWNPVSYKDFIIDKKDLLSSFLNNIKERNKIIYLETYEDEENAIIGYMDSLNENTITVKNYDCYGEYEGTIILNLESISVYIYNSKITRKTEKLLEG